MHSTLVRAQNVFGFFTTVAFVIAALIAATDFIHPRTPSAKVSVDKVQVIRGRPAYYSRHEEQYANIRFSLDADLSSLFTWNTKQAFVYVSAVWPSNTTSSSGRGSSGKGRGADLEKGGSGNGTLNWNEAVIWDTIITAPSSDHLANLPRVAKRKLVESGKGKSIDPSRGILKLRNQAPKYKITAPGGKLENTKDVKLYVHYNVQPWVGVLTWTAERDFGLWRKVRGGVSKGFVMPGLKPRVESSRTATQ